MLLSDRHDAKASTSKYRFSALFVKKLELLPLQRIVTRAWLFKTKRSLPVVNVSLKFQMLISEYANIFC